MAYRKTQKGKGAIAMAVASIGILLAGTVVSTLASLGIISVKDTDKPIVDDRPAVVTSTDEKPVRLTSDMWVTGWVINADKAVDMSRFDGLDTIMQPIECNTKSKAYAAGRVGVIGVDGGALVVSPTSEVSSIAYFPKGSDVHIQLSLYGWVRTSGYTFETLTGKYTVELPFAVKYDVSNYDLIKDFMSPIVDKTIKSIKPDVELNNGDVLKGFTFSNSSLPVNLDGFYDGQELLRGYIIDASGNSPAMDGNYAMCIRVETYNDQKRLVCSYPGITASTSSYGDSIAWTYSSNSTFKLNYNTPAYLVVTDASAYYQNGLWRILEPIFAERVDDYVRSYTIDFSQINYSSLNEYTGNYFSITRIQDTAHFNDAPTLYCIAFQVELDSNYTKIQNVYYCDPSEIATFESNHVDAKGYMETFYFTPVGNNLGSTTFSIETNNSIAMDVLADFVQWLQSNGYSNAVQVATACYR